MSDDKREEIDEAAGLYVISVAAELSGLHPQTLRQYDRIGLVSPSRTVGRNRRYSLRDIASLRTIQRLIGEGINHAGIKRIIELESAMANMALEVAKLRIEVDALLTATKKIFCNYLQRRELTLKGVYSPFPIIENLLCGST